MIPVTEIQEVRFHAGDEMMDYIESQSREDYEVIGRKIEVSEDGVLRAGSFEGPLARTAWAGLLEELSVPANFARKVCPPDLAAAVVNRLLRDYRKRLRVRTVNGVARGIMPLDRLPIKHLLLGDWLPHELGRYEATLGADALRITFTQKDIEVLPDDVYGQGWEIINDENGLRGTEARRYVRRLVCSNGMIGMHRSSAFRRRTSSLKPVLEALSELRDALQENDGRGPQRAARWASRNRVEDSREDAVEYLSGRLEGTVTRTLLQDVRSESTWYDLLNTITAQGRSRDLMTRRQYELLGGQLMRWFHSEGRGTPPWGDPRCADCTFSSPRDRAAETHATMN